MHLAGLIYKEFIHDVHVLDRVPKGWKSYEDPPINYTIRFAWDVHDAIPQAILFIATAPTGESFVYDEMFFSRLIGENAEELKKRIAGRFVVDQLIDPKAVIESPVTETTIIDELAAFGLFFDLGSKDMALGISKTREKLLERNLAGKPTLYFSPNVTQTKFEIGRYCYNPRTQRPKDEDDHMMENLRRLILTGLNYVEPWKPGEKLVRRPTDIHANEDQRGEAKIGAAPRPVR
jgi:hypothetical protein